MQESSSQTETGDKAANQSRKLILEELYKKPTEKDVKRVMEFGERNEYPELILVRQDGKVTKYLGRGIDSWNEALSWAKLTGIYQDNFKDVLKAIDIYETCR